MTSEASEVVRINSVQIEDNSRGTTITAKAYGATIQEAEEEAVASIQRLRVRLKAINQLAILAPVLVEMLKVFVEDTPCRLDHAGYCQEHGVSKPCRNQQALEMIALAEGVE